MAATWVLTRGLQTVRAEFNDVFPQRLRTSDGSIGNLAHQGAASGHNPDRTGNAEYRDGDGKNEVRAIDVDKDLIPGSRIDWMERSIQYLVLRGRAGHWLPFRYFIYKRRIWRETTGWKTEAYTGSNAHDEHAHFSGGRSQKADEWTGSLGLASVTGEDDMDSKELIAALRSKDGRDALGDALTGAPVGNSGETVGVAIQRSRVTDQLLPQILKLVSADVTVDTGELAEAMAPLVSATLLPALAELVKGSGGTPLTQTQVTEAVKAALREGTR
jgi:hypothetical protein